MNVRVQKLTTANVTRSHRLGVSLVELLVVMAVIVLLAGLTLPSFRSMLQDQRVTQAARIVQGVADSARARAIALGRPVALILDRVPVDPTALPEYNLISDNTCNRMSIGEVFPPYEGDWAGTTGDLEDRRDRYGNPYPTSGVVVKDGVPDTLAVEVAKVASLFDMTTFMPNGLVEVGDILQLSDHAQMFSITAISCPSPNTTVYITFDNFRRDSTAEPLWITMSKGIRFRLIRRPTKTLAGSTVLPRGMCIDLSESGIGTSGNEFAVGLRPVPSLADQYGPIYIVFNARGNVDGAYYRFYDSTKSKYDFAAVNPSSVMHLLVGRTEQVAPAGATPVSDREDFVPNLFDVRNVWVSINPYNGAVYSAPNAAILPSPSAVPASLRMQARTFAINVLDARGS